MNQKKVVVIGSGIAGLTAAITMCEKENYEIIIFEKTSSIGGNSKKATSGLSCCSSKSQELRGIKDSQELFFDDTIKSGRNACDKELVQCLVSNSKEALSFLEKKGLFLGHLSQCGGHSVPRTHRCDPEKIKNNVGKEIVVHLGRVIEHSCKNCQIKLNCRVTEMKKNGEKGFSVKYFDSLAKKDCSIDCVGVIFCTGGYSASRDLIEKFSKNLVNYPTTSGDFATGDGIKLAEKFGADIVDMNYIQIHPTGLVNPKKPKCNTLWLAPEALRGLGGLLFNQKGERFVNELELRDEVSKKINENCDDVFNCDKRVAYLLLNESVADQFGISKVLFYEKFGLASEYENLKKLAEEKNLPYERIKKEFEDYSKAKKEGKDRFGKTVIKEEFKDNEKLFLMHVTPSMHYTCGGIRVNPNSQILDKNGKVIDGLFAAGEVCGKIHGKNRLAGNALLECVVFGRKAGFSCFDYTEKIM